jgi:potassium-dependent mechanosensitive channel
LSVVRILRFLLLAALVALGAASPAAADDTPRQVLDASRVALDDIDAALKRDDLTDAELARLRTENDPLGAQLQTVVAQLTPVLEASTKRLAELTPKKKETEAVSDAATAELTAERAKHDALDADLRSARAMLLQADDNSGRISAARRELFARRTFARSSSVLDPFLWSSVAREAPAALDTVSGLISGYAARLSQRVGPGQALGFAILMAGLLAIAVPARWLANRVIALDPASSAPSRLKRAVYTVWKILVLAALPLIAISIVKQALDYFELSDFRMQSGADALFEGLRAIAIANALGRGLLSPGHAKWRLPAISDRAALLLLRFIVVAATIWAIVRLIEPAADVGKSLNIAIATHAVGALLIALAFAGALRRIAGPLFAAPPPAPDPWAPARTFGWALTVLVLGAVLTGYVAFATFLIDQAFFVSGVGAALYLADALIQEGAGILLKPDSGVGRALMTMVGLRRETLEQLVVLIQGFARLAALVAALAVILRPFGLPGQNLAATLRAAYFGFNVGGVTISIYTLLAAAVLFVLVVIATRAVQSWLGERFLPHTRLDAGVSNSIRTIVGYLGVIAAVAIAGARLGLDLEKFALIAGALSVGIGFGLQGIVNNFVSGLILLWERGIRVGDWIVVGPDQGFVRRINARATEIETFDRATLIVPNTTLVTGAVKNWMYADRLARIIVAVNVAYESDPEAVRELLIAAAKAQQQVLSIPAPLVLFGEFGDWALKFQLVCFVDDPVIAERIRSELNFDVFRRMREAGLRIPYPK